MCSLEPRFHRPEEIPKADQDKMQEKMPITNMIVTAAAQI
jgi:hypothetical protein